MTVFPSGDITRHQEMKYREIEGTEREPLIKVQLQDSRVYFEEGISLWLRNWLSFCLIVVRSFKAWVAVIEESKYHGRIDETASSFSAVCSHQLDALEDITDRPSSESSWRERNRALHSSYHSSYILIYPHISGTIIPLRQVSHFFLRSNTQIQWCVC